MLRAAGLVMLLAGTAACSSLGASGPSTGAINKADTRPLADARIQIVDVSDAVARRIIASGQTALFSDALGEGQPVGNVIGKGDVLDISVWEAPPAVLFGSISSDARLASAASMRSTTIPEQMVDTTGRIVIPFAGALNVAGRSTHQVESDIVSRLSGKAHDPQAIVRIVRNASANVTVVGDVASSARVPLTARGERLLDVLAGAGGVRQPVGKTMIQISRSDRTVSLPLEQIIRDPRQNVRMQPDDVVTAYFQPYSFIAMGATGSNAEVNFESTGITLAQALGRIGGLRDDKANPRGVFIFRLEDPAALDAASAASTARTPDGKVPVIYRIDLSDPASFFVAQGFPVRNKDVVYVSSAPVSDLQKFVNIVSSMAFSIVGITNIAQ
ncbi:polysaccharide export protein [Novosphingobium sp. SL115]|uniref:polysaccharide biosynthesis/export family protein n=1 Tax=Novosphingobium sp. SL115 TaxID=2995150 RepID=UPI002273973C|nr:polysaccharide biosynthesis/export family protein [Novosphingobium sp. SL115]MCY1670969.1 polysaccharide export protein [Novosphingobium sp. SL115]